MGNEFLSASLDAARGLAAARQRHARGRARADGRLASAQAVHEQEVQAAAQIEADAWRELMAVPGMTIATAAQIGDISARAVHSWLATAAPTPSSGSECS